MPPKLQATKQGAVPRPETPLLIYVMIVDANADKNHISDVQDVFRGYDGFFMSSCQTLVYRSRIRDLANDGPSLERSGRRFLEWLDNLYGTKMTMAKSLILVGEMLGGLVIKETLRIMNQLPKLREALDLLSGIVFLITPHVGKDKDDTTVRFRSLVLHDSNIMFQAASSSFLSQCATCTHDFGELDLTIPILSIYETGANRFRSSHGIIVDKDFVRTNHAREQLLALDVPLGLMFDPTRSNQTRDQMMLFLMNIVKEPEVKLLKVSQQKKNPTIRESTLQVSTPSYSLYITDNATPVTLCRSRPRQLQVKLPSLSSSMGFRQSASTQHNKKKISSSVLLTSLERSSLLTELATETSTSNDKAVTMRGLAAESQHVKLPCYFTQSHTRNSKFVSCSGVMDLIETELLNPEAGGDTSGLRPRTFVLQGNSGTRKTEIAVEFLFSHLENFDAIFFFHADQPAALAEQYNQAAVKLGIRGSLSADTGESRELMMQWLANPEYHSTWTSSNDTASKSQLAKWLIIFDNVNDMDVLMKYWPTTGNGSILVTGNLVQRLQRHPLVTETEVAIFANILADWLQSYPLAITQIASIIQMRKLDLLKLISLYGRTKNLKESQSVKIFPIDRLKFWTATVWENRIFDPGSRALLCVMSVLGANSIQEKILLHSPHDAHKINYPNTTDNYYKSLEPLLKSSLVSRNGTDYTLSVNQSVAKVVRESMLKDGDFLDTFYATVEIVSSVWPFGREWTRSHYNEVRAKWKQGWMKDEEAKEYISNMKQKQHEYDELYPHVYRLFRSLPEHPSSMLGLRRWVDLMFAAASFQSDRGKFHEAGRLFSEASRILDGIVKESARKAA